MRVKQSLKEKQTDLRKQRERPIETVRLKRMEMLRHWERLKAMD
jgi:hypothetical protein